MFLALALGAAGCVAMTDEESALQDGADDQGVSTDEDLALAAPGEVASGERAAFAAADGEPAHVSIQAWAECSIGFLGTNCRTGTVPHRPDLDRVWVGVEGYSGLITDWRVRDMDTNVVVGSGRVNGGESFRTGIYGLVGQRYRLELDGYWQAYGFICDC
jgi:hypothetical protein